MRRLIIPALVVVLAAAGIGSAQGLEWQLAGRALYVTGADPTAVVGSTGRTLDLGSGGGIEVDATMMISERFGVELSLGASRHRLRAVGEPACCGGTIDGGDLWLPALTVMARYHQPAYGPWDPYVGIGVSWAEPIYDMSTELEDAGVERLEIDGNPGIAVQIGVNYDMDNRWYANLDLRYLGVSLDARTRLADGDAKPVSIDIKPWVIGAGFGYRF